MSQPVSLSSDTQISRAPQGGESGPLKTLVIGILVVVLISSLSINLLLYRQHHDISESLKLKQAQVQQIETLFNERQKPVIDSLVGALTVFSKTSPDFAPILAKFRSGAGTETPSASSTNANPKR